MGEKNFNILLKKYSFGGTLDTLSKFIPFADQYKININLIDLNINPKKNGGLLIRNIDDLNFIYNLKYNTLNILYKNKNIFKEQILFFIKTLCIKYKFFSLVIKFICLILSMNFEKAKNRYRKFFHAQNYIDGNYNQKNYNYLKKFKVLLKEGDFQKIYFNRKSFDIDKEIFFENTITKKKYVCMYVREKSYNLKHNFLKKKNDVIWYGIEDFKEGIYSIINKNLNIIDLSLFKSDTNIPQENYLNIRKNLSYKEIFSIVKNCELFLSTGGGGYEMAKIFKKPTLKVDHEYNIINNFDFSTEKDNIIFCKVFSRIKKRFLSIKEQFESLENLFPNIKYNLNFKFNHDDYEIIKNSNNEIKTLTDTYTFNEEQINEIRQNQTEIFNIKNFYLKKFLPDYFYLMNSNYPINPIINKKFFDDTKDFSDYLENDTVIYNQRKND